MARPRGTVKQRKEQRTLANGAGRLIGYVRVSTTEQGETGHSLHGQRARLQEAAERAGFELVEVVAEVESGAKERDGLREAQERVKAGEAEGLLFPKLDRLGRSQLHLAGLIEWARDSGVTLLSADEGPMVDRGRLVNEALPFLVALAQVERERISRRTKEGLKAAKQRGVQLGRPAENTELQARATELRRQGVTLQGIADLFNTEGLRTARGAMWRPGGVYRMVQREDPAANPVGGYGVGADEVDARPQSHEPSRPSETSPQNRGGE